MSRRRRASKRKMEPDPVYQNKMVAEFINKVMQKGKKSLARKIVYESIKKFCQKIKSDRPVESFQQALENAMPTLEVKSRRIGGATYQVPVEIPQERRASMAMRWIIAHAQEKVGRSMIEGLSAELIDCYQNQGATIKKKDETHRMAEANRAFAHYKW
ncbi:MAG: 30S ribosomal protein S7 [Chlamydiae bacterium]|nr:30S ribosomal protein S7 [Chlamydiota bacterium]